MARDPVCWLFAEVRILRRKIKFFENLSDGPQTTPLKLCLDDLIPPTLSAPPGAHFVQASHVSNTKFADVLRSLMDDAKSREVEIAKREGILDELTAAEIVLDNSDSVHMNAAEIVAEFKSELPDADDIGEVSPLDQNVTQATAIHDDEPLFENLLKIPMKAMNMPPVVHDATADDIDDESKSLAVKQMFKTTVQSLLNEHIAECAVIVNDVIVKEVVKPIFKAMNGIMDKLEKLHTRVEEIEHYDKKFITETAQKLLPPSNIFDERAIANELMPLLLTMQWKIYSFRCPLTVKKKKKKIKTREEDVSEA